MKYMNLTYVETQYKYKMNIIIIATHDHIATVTSVVQLLSKQSVCKAMHLSHIMLAIMLFLIISLVTY